MSTPTAAPSVPSLGSQKLAQAQSLLAEAGLDAWLMVVRETQERPDPTLRYFVDLAFTWNTYFLITRDGALALAATFDAPDLLALGLFDEVRTYKEGPREALLEMLASRNPARIGINVSEDDALADGLTAGLRDSLEAMLRGTPFEGRLQSAEGLVGAVRAVKLAGERERIQRAIDKTEGIFDRIRERIRAGVTAREIAAMFHAEAAREGVPTAWAKRHCPTVTVGAAAAVGHVAPGNEAVTPGCIVHMDFGIVLDGYCSDLQRLWYVGAEKGGPVPEEVRRAHATIVGAIEKAARALKPGVEGWKVDATAREHIVAAGFPEYAHALGHHLGCAVHDGGGVLGPRWERYGKEPLALVREGAVYTLEPSIHLPEHGMVALEEDVVVEAGGARFLSRFARELPVLPPA
jgi:Xaa-Pro aminopeptidase